jgi:F420H(2)-dependent quinone reductase
METPRSVMAVASGVYDTQTTSDKIGWVRPPREALGRRACWPDAPVASDSPGSGVANMPHTRERLRRFLIRAMSRTHSGVYRASGGRLLGRLAGMPVLLLTTTGRRSGTPRTAALTYFRDGAELVVVGSFGGSDLAPAWWLNLQRDPRARVLIGRTTSRVTARAATVEEHDRLWPLVTTTYPGYARYQERTSRLIPIVMLTPEDAEPRGS